VAPGGDGHDDGVQAGYIRCILERMIHPSDAGRIARGLPTGMQTLLRLDQFLLFVVTAAALLAALGLVWRAEVRPSLFWGTAVASAVVLCFDLGVLFFLHLPGLGVDYQFFRAAGGDVWAGLDPYDPSRASRDHLNPPTALPLFALFALLPGRTGFVVWTVLNVVACLALPVYARRVLTVQAQAGDPAARARRPLPPWGIAGLTAAVAVSEAARTGLYLGQLSILTALLLLAALDAQGRRRPVLAGVWLALATMKVATVLPFLLLFLRKGDGRTWLSLIAACALLIAVTGHAAPLPDDLAALLHRIARLAAPGKVNDYSFEGPRNAGIFGFDHALYRLGLRDRRTIAIAQASALLVTGLWVARQVVPGRMPRGAACALVACFSTIFLYHRNYDSVILALPLVCLTEGARSEAGRPRWAHALGATSVLLVLYLNLKAMVDLTNRSTAWGVGGRLAQAVVLPYATWLVLLTMVLLVYGGSDGRAGEAPPAPGRVLPPLASDHGGPGPEGV
jgi:hypothetical protein